MRASIISLSRRIIPARAGFTCDADDGHCHGEDHPRSRGVYGDVADAHNLAQGSSPLARGLPYVSRHKVAPSGIIPARAGFTHAPSVRASDFADHPRSRGVYSARESSIPMMKGSSPLARGLRRRARCRACARRIIPARAGFTEDLHEGREDSSDHPRSRGVYLSEVIRGGMRAGSSPLARGLRIVGLVGCPRGRIIPARAGFTPSPRRGWRHIEDHPRSRGVYSSDTICWGSGNGSSPLARGLPTVIPAPPKAPGIIPARAGFTSRNDCTDPASTDHPRSRGVYPRRLGSIMRACGSSPLARGLLANIDMMIVEDRIIPARAGFTLAVFVTSWAREDHPRSRGVYRRRRPRVPALQGSSPLARGLHPRWPCEARRSRIIPARAGFTVVSAPVTGGDGDHPRPRGVYGRSPEDGMMVLGSSPLARGLPGHSSSYATVSGIIPARAGFTRDADDGHGDCEDHPRSRGVY